MDRCNFLLPAIVTFMASFLGQSLVGSEAIDARIDVVVLVDNKDGDITWQLKSSLKMVPAYFTLGPDNARLAIVSCIQGPMDDASHYRWVLMNLSADPSLFQRTIENPTFYERATSNGKSVYVAYWGRTLDAVRAEIFGHAESTDRAKVVILIMSQPGADQLEDKAKAQTLRDAGVWLYIVAMNDLDTRVSANEIAANPNRVVITSDGALASSISSVARAIHRDLCQWDSACRYADKERKQCQLEQWMVLPYMKNISQCNEFKPSRTCGSLEDCSKECDQRWPWEKEPDCTVKCGVDDGQRLGTVPPMMADCPQSIACPACTQAGSTSAASASAGTTMTRQQQYITHRTTTPAHRTILNVTIAEAHLEKAGTKSLYIMIGVIVPNVIIVIAIVVAVVVAVVRRRRRVGEYWIRWHPGAQAQGGVDITATAAA